jgi:hypothetical protein
MTAGPGDTERDCCSRIDRREFEASRGGLVEAGSVTLK